MSAVVLRGDAAHLPLPDGSVDLIVTSPPYWGVRDYRDGGESLAGQIGNEERWQDYLANLLTCTREWVRVLKPEGSIFVNLGDKYANDAKWGGATSGEHVQGLHGKTGIGRAKVRTGIPAKSLIGLPWRYGLACVDDLGLILRRDNIWHKRDAMPESVDDRCATKHEYIIHLAKRQDYFSAIDEIREPSNEDAHTLSRRNRKDSRLVAANAGQTSACNPLGKLPGSVWDITTVPLNVPERIEHARCCGGRKRFGCEDGLDHHAAYPPALVQKILLGWSPSGICVKCGEGRQPVVDRQRIDIRPGYSKTHNGARDGIPQSGGTKWKTAGRTDVVITGYACACADASAPTRPAVVLDPFGGTGTMALVADVLGRTGITVDRSGDYCRLAMWRTRDPGERARALGVPKPPPVPENQGSLFDDLEAS